MKLPKISVITPSFNQGQFLEETILSVLNQNYPNLEYIIVDGVSTDNSVEIIKRYQHNLAYWVSEPDKGQADAINKGISQATGDILAFLNSDDLYLPGALHAIAHHFSSRPKCRWLCGRWIWFGLPTRSPQFFDVQVPRDAAACLFENYQASQPAHFWKRELFERNGKFDINYLYCFDHEFYARLLFAGEKCEALDFPLSAYRLHHSSKTMAEWDKFDYEFSAIRDKYKSRLPIHRLLKEAAKKRARDSHKLLWESIHDWRSGDRRAALATAARGVLMSPHSIGLYILLYPARVIGRAIKRAQAPNS